MRKSSFYVIVILCFSWCHANRFRRTLVYPPPRPSIAQMVVGVGLPLVLQEEAVIIGTVLKSGYFLPYNSTVYTNPSNVVTEKRRKKRSYSRWDIYEALSQILEIQGFGGKACILRIICELGSSKLVRSHGILEEIVHTLFTPSSTNEVPEKHTDSLYYAAEVMGKENLEYCNFAFKECSENLFDIFTRLY